MPTPSNASERLIVALDFPTTEQALTLVRQLQGVVTFYKVGLELFGAAGPDFVRSLVAQGNKVFLDLKFLDIEETVRRAVRQVAQLGATFLTIHESGKAVAAAVEAVQGSGLQILAVTVLTDLDTADLHAMGFSCTAEELVLRRARNAIAVGCHGVVASGREASKIRAFAGDKLTIVTPGIRLATAGDDQKRAVSPREAISSGADYLVLGRPINRAADPRGVAQQFIDEIHAAAPKID